MRNTQLTDLCLTKLPKLVDLVLEEHEHQINRYGVRTCTSSEWMLMVNAMGSMGGLSGAIAEHEYRDGPTRDVTHEAIQAATLCLKIAEMYIDLEDKDD